MTQPQEHAGVITLALQTPDSCPHNAMWDLMGRVNHLQKPPEDYPSLDHYRFEAMATLVPLTAKRLELTQLVMPSAFEMIRPDFVINLARESYSARLWLCLFGKAAANWPGATHAELTTWCFEQLLYWALRGVVRHSIAQKREARDLLEQVR